jgi:hypothetical protein
VAVAVALEWGEPSEGERELLRAGVFEPLVGEASFTVSGPDGGFALSGVPAGRIAVVARGLPGSRLLLPARVEPVEVRPGETTELPDIVLREPDDEEVVAGVVLAPDGMPVPGASVLLADESGSRRLPGGTLTSAAGRFELLVPRGTTLRLSARAAGFGGVEVAGVRGGDRNVVLRFERVPELPPAGDPTRAR